LERGGKERWCYVAELAVREIVEKGSWARERGGVLAADSKHCESARISSLSNRTLKLELSKLEGFTPLHSGCRPAPERLPGGGRSHISSKKKTKRPFSYQQSV